MAHNWVVWLTEGRLLSFVRDSPPSRSGPKAPWGGGGGGLEGGGGKKGRGEAGQSGGSVWGGGSKWGNLVDLI